MYLPSEIDSDLAKSSLDSWACPSKFIMGVGVKSATFVLKWTDLPVALYNFSFHIIFQKSEPQISSTKTSGHSYTSYIHTYTRK